MAMELLMSNLDFVRVPELDERLHTRECCISFETRKSKGGLFVDMNSFLAFGKEYVGWNYEKTGNPVYLRIKETPQPFSEGAEVGFDNSNPEYQKNYEIVILPRHVTIPLSSEELPPEVRLAVNSIINDGTEGKDAGKKFISKHAMDLKQLDNGVLIPLSGWKCEMCDKTNNLWLNLTDGSILCGQSNLDGTGGNTCALSHYDMTKYPLVVKLGTITADLEAADVYSYDEDANVRDPLLAQHLQHFGFEYSSLQKTEVATSEKELIQKNNCGWNRIQESEEDAEPLFGPSYTGLVDLNTSCYLAAILQVVFSTRSFCSRYYFGQSLQVAFATAEADPTMDFNMQLTKLAHGLLSGKYSIPATKKMDGEESEHTTLTAKQDGITPGMFKSVIAGSHPEFSTAGQRDALEFFLQFLDQVEEINTESSNFDPSRSFKFCIEERFQCFSGKVAYIKRFDYILSLDIPLHKAINKKELEDFQKLKAENYTELEELSSDKIVRPMVPLMACLDYFSAPEEFPGFCVTFLNPKTTVIRTAGLTSFPDYLAIHVQKFVQEADWDPKKLDVCIDVPDIIDISHMRSKRLLPGEELLPEPAEESITVDENTVVRLASMGFTDLQSQKAAINTSNAGVGAASSWLLNHMNDPDMDDPELEKQSKAHADPSKVDTSKSFGFSEETARKALRSSDDDTENTTELIFNHSSSTSGMDLSANSSSSTITVDDPLPDGEGKYQLFGVVSHIGSSMHSGHYVAHILKEGRWVIFDDEKVAVSKNPSFEDGYLYFFQRIDHWGTMLRTSSKKAGG